MILSRFMKQNKDNPKFELTMLHFFINTGIHDNAYYWNELLKCVNVYCDLKKIAFELTSLNIGGGFPIKNSYRLTMTMNTWLKKSYRR